MGWRDVQRERDEALEAELRRVRAAIEDLKPAVELRELPEPAQRPLSRFPGLAVSVRLCRDYEAGATLLQMLKPVPRSHRSGVHGLTVGCPCGSATRVVDTLRPCVGDCGRWFVGDESGVWSVMLPVETAV
jgi:hypothetical protein